MKKKQQAIEINKLDSTKDENEIISEVTNDSPSSEDIRSSPRSEETVLPTENNHLDCQNKQRPNLIRTNNLPLN